MEPELTKLLERARDGLPETFGRLVDALRTRSKSNTQVLIQAFESEDDTLIRAAIEAARGRTEPELLAVLAKVMADAPSHVRQHLATTISNAPTWKVDKILDLLLSDTDQNIRQAAVWAVQCRPALHPLLIQQLPTESVSWVRSQIANALAESKNSDAFSVLLEHLVRETSQDVQHACACAAEQQLGQMRDINLLRRLPDHSVLAEISRWVRNYGNNGYRALGSWLDDMLGSHVDVEQLASYGAVLSAPAQRNALTRAHNVDTAINNILKVIAGAAPRAAVLVGESGTGKTAIVHELTHRLMQKENGAWHVLQISPPEWLTNTKFTGEWETRVRDVVLACKAPRRVLIYIPNLEELVWMGAWEKSEANVATALAPFLERGEVAVLGESTPEGFRKGLGSRGPLRRLFTLIDVPEATPKETRAILHEVVRDSGVDMADAAQERLLEFADYFNSGTAQPGRAVGLLRRVLSNAVGSSDPITDREIIQTISASTGVPTRFLDDSTALRRTELVRFFESRVMGQPEAIEAVVDLVTLVKAGLTDPSKPFGVLLFVGPTGVGKTELARALAELLFGDASRMIRLDMSEFATYEAFERLIGQGLGANEPGRLTAAVREKPFSVLLFDEIEKAHPNIYNLCLQIFDAGRLTDTQGRTADFRRAIIVLTSNVGTAAVEPGMADVLARRQVHVMPDREAMLRELSRWFRPEFLNRIDRVVTFRALTEETAESIARREVMRVLERRGIARRRLAVEVSPEVMPLLLREGYSQVYGARPLKRTVERLVLQPVAQAIAAGDVPSGSVLKLVARAGRVVIEVSAPEEPESDVPELQPVAINAADRANTILKQLREMHAHAESMQERKSVLLDQSSEPGFWDQPSSSRLVLDEIHRLDSILSSLAGLEKRLSNSAEQAERRGASKSDLRRLQLRLDGLESEFRHIAFLMQCSDQRALCDAFVTLRLVALHGGKIDGVALLARMYRALAERRGLETTVLDDHQRDDATEDIVTFRFSGPGAFALFACEDGIHQIIHGKRQTREGKRRPAEREVVRVEVLPAPLGEPSFGRDEVRCDVRVPEKTKGRFGKLKHEVHLFHAPTMTAVQARLDGSKSEALEQLQSLLHSRIEAARNCSNQGDSNRTPTIRRYTLGPTTLVRDIRTGRVTGRLDQVLDGHLDAFLRPPGQSQS